MPNSSNNLAGRVILDCSTLLPGPLIGKLLAEQGARVIKIENPDQPDGATRIGSMYEDLNTLKELQLLNLKRPDDKERFRALVAHADALIEGFRPEAKRRLGLDELSLHAINPKLCIVSLVGYPEEGPWAERPGHDLNFSALSGALSLFNEMPALPLADLFSAYHGAFALASAMDAVSRGGAGTRIVVSMLEVMKDLQSGIALQFRKDGKTPTPGTTLFSGIYPCYRIYRARCGRRVAVGAIEHKFWQKVCEILGVKECEREGYAIGEHGIEVISLVQIAFDARPWSSWAPLFEAAQCCVEPVLEYEEVYGN